MSETNKISVAGLLVNAATKRQVLDLIAGRLDRGERTFITTPYSEFLYAALRDHELMELLNRADISVADGIAVLWAAKYLALPLRSKGYYAKILEALWQMKYTLAAILFWPKYIRSAVPEKIIGVDLFMALAALAAGRAQSIYLLGGFGDTAERVADFLRRQYPGIKIAGVSSKNPNDPTVLAEIKQAQPDFLFVAYGPMKQERWIAEHWGEMGQNGFKVKLAIGLGGTFDYIARKRASPPGFVRRGGWEWLFRLITQPKRFPRIINATFGLMSALWHYKVFASLPLRKNVAVAILNQNNEVLVCRRNPKDFYLISDRESLKSQNYWQLPQGGVGTNENVVEAATREAMEETGIETLEFLKISSEVHIYIWNNTWRGFWKNRKRANRGQTQNVAYFYFFGTDEEVKIDQHEFVDFKWVDVKDLDKVVHPERINLIKIVQEDLKDLA